MKRLINRTVVSDRRLDGVALLQQHLDARRRDVPIPSGHARRLHATCRRRHTDGEKELAASVRVEFL